MREKKTPKKLIFLFIRFGNDLIKITPNFFYIIICYFICVYQNIRSSQ